MTARQRTPSEATWETLRSNLAVSQAARRPAGPPCRRCLLSCWTGEAPRHVHRGGGGGGVSRILPNQCVSDARGALCVPVPREQPHLGITWSFPQHSHLCTAAVLQMRGTLLSSHNPVRAASSSSTCPGDQPMTWEPLALVPFHSSDDMHDEHCGLHSFAVRHDGIKRWMHACVLGCWLGGLGMRQRCTMVGRRATLARLSRLLLCATCPCCGARASDTQHSAVACSAGGAGALSVHRPGAAAGP